MKPPRVPLSTALSRVDFFRVTILAIISTLLMIVFGIAWDTANMRARRAEQQITDLYATIQKLKDNDHHDPQPHTDLHAREMPTKSIARR